MRLLLLLAALAAPAFAAQSKAKLDPCAYCKDDPALLAKAGLLTHGPIPVAKIDSTRLASSIPAARWRFLESAHFRVATSLDAVALSEQEQAALQPELDALRALFPEIAKKPRKLDADLRLHLQIFRLEKLYGRLQSILRVTDADFPESRRAEGPYMGNGRFLGEKDKFEFVLHASDAAHARFIRDFSGATVTDSLRWHFSPEHKLLVSVPCSHLDRRSERGLMAHLAHNFAHVGLAAYKHDSYDPPIWIDEGLALLLEKEIDPAATTTEGEEGTQRETKSPKDFELAARKLAAAGERPTLPELLAMKNFSELGVDGQVKVCSLVRFLIAKDPVAFAKLLGGIKGQLDDKGYPSGADLAGLQRRLLAECYALKPTEIDAAWRAWVLAEPTR